MKSTSKTKDVKIAAAIKEVRQLQKIAGILKEGEEETPSEETEAEEADLKKRLIGLMVDDCIENYDSDFDKWYEYGLSVIPPEIEDAIEDLAKVVGEDNVNDVVENEILTTVRQEVADSI